MNRAEAEVFVEKQQHGVLTTLFPDGRPQSTPIVYGTMEGAIEISMTWDRVKTRNLGRDPRASLCILPENGWYPYLTVEGRAELVEDPDGRKNLALYRRITGKDPDDLEEYLRAMKDEKRLVVRLSMDRLYPVQG